MSALGERIERERQVVCTLLLRESAHTELPETFSESAFESPEYRSLYVIMSKDFFCGGNPARIVELEKRFPELKPLLDNVTYPATVLNGEFRAMAASLIRHRSSKLVQESSSVETGTNVSEGIDREFKFELLNGMEICDMDIPEQSFLVKNLISECSVNFLSGEEGCGKSLLAMNLALSIAVGASKWLAYDVAKQGKVLYLNNELAFSDFARRLKSMSQSLPARGDISNLIVPKEVPALTECWNTLNEVCEREKPCLIVVDCLYFAHDKDENDSSQMKALMRQFLALRDRFHLALLLIHHTKKAARYEKMHNDQMRGSNVFGGITDTVLQVRRSAADESKRIIKPTKFRHVSDENRKCKLLSLNNESLWFKDEGETDEGEHIASANPTAEEEIDFREIFGEDGSYPVNRLSNAVSHWDMMSEPLTGF